MAACFAARGFQVHAVDLNPQKVDAIGRGIPPVYEPGLAELLCESAGRITATCDIEPAVQNSDATFIVVSTPSEQHGGFSLRYVLPTCEAIGRALRVKSAYHLVVLTSTVMPGSTGGPIKSTLERFSSKCCGTDFGLCYGPEFIALGTAIRDFYHPDFLLIGESDSRAGDVLSDIYKRTCKNSPAIARMNWINAEITKLAVNTYITTKISYANMLARLCEKLPDTDVNVVTDALGLDTRIGPKYLKGAVSYGGPCFPRDNRAFAALAARSGALSDLADATDRFNREQITVFAELVKSHHSRLQDSASAARVKAVGILGVTYKPNTDVVEESFGLLLAQELSSTRVEVIVYDPAPNATQFLSSYRDIRVASSAQECIAESGVVVVATPWQEFRDLPVSAWSCPAHTAPRIVIDCWRALHHLECSQGIQYIKLGFGAASDEKVQPVAGIAG